MTTHEIDFLDEFIAERTTGNPAFPDMVQAALNHRELMRQLAETRQELRISQTKLAAEISTSQSQVARAESGYVDVRLSTVSKMASALGKRVQWVLVDADVESRDSVERSAR